MDDTNPLETGNKELSDRPPVGTLVDFVDGVDENNPLDIEVAVNDTGKVVVFHNKKFKKDIAWFEFDLESNHLDFVLDNGDIRNASLPLTPNVSKYMHNSYQILTVYMDNKTGEAIEGQYIPLIIHKAL